MSKKAADEHTHDRTVHTEKVTTTMEVTDVTTSGKDDDLSCKTTVHTVTTTSTSSEKTVIYDADESVGGMEMTECVKVVKNQEEDLVKETVVENNLPCGGKGDEISETYESHRKETIVEEHNSDKTIVNPDNGGMEMTECLPSMKASLNTASPALPAQPQNQTLCQPENGGMEMTECLPSMKASMKTTSPAQPQNQTVYQPDNGGMEMTECLPKFKTTLKAPSSAGATSQSQDQTMYQPDNGGMEMTVGDGSKRRRGLRIRFLLNRLILLSRGPNTNSRS